MLVVEGAIAAIGISVKLRTCEINEYLLKKFLDNPLHRRQIPYIC